MTDGDKEKAVELLKEWAYGFPIKSLAKDDITEKLIWQYLEPDADVDSACIAKFIQRYINNKRDLDYDAIHKAIMAMERPDFYTTAYWASLSTYIKNEAGKVCQKCGKSGVRLNTVYKTYKHVGYELQHLDDLQCLCEDCTRSVWASVKDWEKINDKDR